MPAKCILHVWSTVIEAGMAWFEFDCKKENPWTE